MLTFFSFFFFLYIERIDRYGWERSREKCFENDKHKEPGLWYVSEFFKRYVSTPRKHAVS